MSLISSGDLKKLLLLLQNENLRSAYLNAFPGRSISKFDLGLLDSISEDFSSKLLNNLLTKNQFKQKIEIKPDFKDDNGVLFDASSLVRKIQKLYLRALDYERERGFKVVYLGYPLVQRVQSQNSDKKVLAPLFLWEVYLKPSPGYKNWFICRDKGAEIKINTALQLYQRMEGEPDIPDLEEDLSDDGFLNKRALNRILQDILSTGYYKEDLENLVDVGTESGLDVLPSKRDSLFQERAPQNYYKILNSSVLGIFKASKEAIISDLQEYIKMTDLKVPNESIKSAFHSALPLDPSQMQSIPILSAEKNLVIHGPPGTGKSQVLTGLISSAVAEKQKILVVCEKYTALEVIKNNLEDIGLKKSVALITDVKKDRKKIALVSRSLAEEDLYSRKNDVKVDLQKKYELKHQTHVERLKEPILYDDNWTTVVGKYLGLKGLKTLAISQKTLETWLTKDESIVTSIRELAELRDKVPNYAFLKGHIKSLQKADAIKIIGELNSIIPTLEDHLSKEKLAQKKAVLRLTKLMNSFIDEIKVYRQAYERELNHWNDLPKKEKRVFQEAGSFLKTINRLFNKRYQEVEKSHSTLETKKVTLSNFISSIANISTYAPHVSLIEKTEEVTDFFRAKLESLKSNFKSQLDFARNYDSEFEEREKRLNQDLLASLKSLIWLNGEKASNYLYDIDVLLNDYNRLKNELTEIETYKRFAGLLKELSISDKSTLFKELFQQDQWANSVVKTLYEYAITRAESNGILGDEYCLDKLREGERRYQQKVQVQIQNACLDLQQEGLRNFQKKGYNVNQVFNLRGSKGRRRNSLKKINRQFREEFTNLFPVILTTPESASTLFKGLRNYFDLVIFDEASQVNLEDAITTLFKGRTIVVAGDEHQMPPSNFFSRANDFEEDEDEDAFDVILDNESLLDFAIKNPSFENQYLDFHYRSEHPILINFSNAAFYGRLLPMPPKYKYKPIEYKWIGGVYTNQTNLKEAEAVIDVLKKIGQQSNKKLPSIGVATLNLKQRNLIFEKIAEEASTNREFQALYERLENENLFIKNLENIQGDERDIIIISTTFGQDEHGRFRQNFGPINQAKGYRLLNVLITRAKEKIFILSSIPSTKINEYQDIIKSGTENGATYPGRGIFYAYLRYCKAVSQSDHDTVQGIINFLEKHNPNYQSSESLDFLESPFEEEVYDVLSSQFDQSELHLQKEEGAFRIDMVVSPKEAPGLRIAIECDGATYHSGYESYHYDIHRQKMLEKSGYHLIRIWSKNWFLNFEGEKRKLLNKIDETIKQHAEEPKDLPGYLTPIYPNIVIEKKTVKKKTTTYLNQSPQNVPIVKKGIIVQLYEKTQHKEFIFKISEQNKISQGKLGVNSPLGKKLIGSIQGEEVIFGKFIYEIQKIIEK
jgi:superfamily I DNA and/or RNA helicase/very-short-patch-repair endonuclease